MLSQILSMITRGKVTSSAVKSRTMLQATGLDNEAFNDVELVLPPGYLAKPGAGADIIILQCNGTRDHKVALAGDTAGQVQADLEDDERGMGGFGSVVIFRNNKLEISSLLDIEIVSAKTVSLAATQKITLSAPIVTSGAAGLDGQPVCLKAFFDWAASHEHPGTSGPTTAPPANGLSTNFGAT